MEFSQEIVVIGDAIHALSPMQATELLDYLKVVHNIEPMGLKNFVPPPNPEVQEKPPEQTEWAVVMTEFDQSKKIGIVKVAREVTGLGLKESMALMATMPVTVKESLPKEEAEKVKKKLEDAGAKVVIK